MISWNVSKEDSELIIQATTRAVDIAKGSGLTLDTTEIFMDLTACHANGNPLRLKELLEADTYNFSHDVFGIYRHIDRETGKLQDCFVPRFSAK